MSYGLRTKTKGSVQSQAISFERKSIPKVVSEMKCKVKPNGQLDLRLLIFTALSTEYVLWSYTSCKHSACPIVATSMPLCHSGS